MDTPVAYTSGSLLPSKNRVVQPNPLNVRWNARHQDYLLDILSDNQVRMKVLLPKKTVID